MRPQRQSIPLAALLVVTGCGSGADDAEPGRTWKVAAEGLEGSIMSFWGLSDEDLFAVGGVPGSGGDGAAVLWRGPGGWTPLNVSAPTLWWVYGFAHDDVWAVGERGTVLHYDGVSWGTQQTGYDYTLWGLWGAARDDLWAVGGRPDGSGPPVLRHYDGDAWHDVDGPSADDGFYFKVWGTAADDVHLVGAAKGERGERGVIGHFDGERWTLVGSTQPARLLTVRGRSPDDVYAVGGVTGGLMVHYDGDSWRTVDLAVDTGLMGVWTAPEQPVVATGMRGLLIVDAGDGAGFRGTEPLTYECLHAAWGSDSGLLVAGGGDMMTGLPGHGVILEFD